jgi:hypothetical protein
VIFSYCFTSYSYRSYFLFFLKFVIYLLFESHSLNRDYLYILIDYDNTTYDDDI